MEKIMTEVLCVQLDSCLSWVDERTVIIKYVEMGDNT